MPEEMPLLGGPPLGPSWHGFSPVDLSGPCVDRCWAGATLCLRRARSLLRHGLHIPVNRPGGSAGGRVKARRGWPGFGCRFGVRWMSRNAATTCADGRRPMKTGANMSWSGGDRRSDASVARRRRSSQPTLGNEHMAGRTDDLLIRPFTLGPASLYRSLLYRFKSAGSRR